MNRVAVYIRVSTEDQADEGFSIEGQLQMAEEYCNKKGKNIVAVYKDEGISGKDIKNRHDMNRFLTDCSRDIFDCVLVWKLSRLGRNQRDTLNIIDMFEKSAIQIFSCTEDIDYNTPTGRMTLHLLGSIAEYERNVMSSLRTSKWG